jgi:sec-independent protein translocase protein TatB
MFDIGWSELVVIGVVALIAIGPKELPGVLRMVGQWIGKARRMAAEFQGQFNEAMREAEMEDIKKTFDDATAAARDLSPTNLLGSLEKYGDSVKPADPLTPTTPEPPTPETFVEAETHAQTALPAPAPADTAVAETAPPAAAPPAVVSPPDLPDAKAS